VPHAFVTLRAGSTVDAERLVAYTRERLAGFKVPKHIVFDALPRTSTGKIQKTVLRARVRDALTGPMEEPS